MLITSLLIPAFIAGLLIFLAPCTLPIVPGYLAFISGINAKDLKNNTFSKAQIQKRVRKNALFFVLGFSLIFILLGLALGLAGSFFGPYREILMRIGGIIIFFFGFMMLGVFSLPFLNQEKRIKLPSWLKIGTSGSSLLIGGFFALGWSPCIGPILGTILVLAGTLGTALQGTILLAVFSLGLAVPFLVLAFFYSRSNIFVGRLSKWSQVISIIGGILLMVIGILLLFNSWSLFQEWGFELLNFINYQSIEQYL